MGRRLTDDFVQWTARITLKRCVEVAVRDMAALEARSTATMIGILLEKAITARSSA